MLSPQGSAMREYQPVSPPHLSAIERPRCPACDHQRMLLSKIEAGPAGFDRRTFESCSDVDDIEGPNAIQRSRVAWRRTQAAPIKHDLRR